MNISNALGVAANFESEGLQNIIANVLEMVLVDVPVLSPHAFPQLRTKLPLEVDTLISSQVCMYVISSGVYLLPSQEIIRK